MEKTKLERALEMYRTRRQSAAFHGRSFQVEETKESIAMELSMDVIERVTFFNAVAYVF